MGARAGALLLLACVALAPASAAAQDAPKPDGEERPTGLPSALDWTFHFDAGWGTFGFANSLYNNPKEPGIAENLSDQWFEGYVKPGLSLAYTLPSESQIYGKVSAVGERTYGSVPPAFGADVSSFGPEDLFVGWRSGKALTIGENAIDLSIGRNQYKLGHGFLVYDGASEGGTRGGYWTNARKAFELAAVGRVHASSHTAEVFYLDRDELPANDSGSRTWGANYEHTIGEHTTLGATYMRWFADPAVRPQRDGLHVFNLRAYTSPLTAVPGLAVEAEYASERNGEALDSNAWTVQGAYTLEAVAWSPVITYRYAFFQGDDPQTAANEAFDPLFLGFYDWGTWWQGEIAGEYFLSNSNLRSHMIRAHVAPSEAIGAGLIYFRFLADQPRSYGPGVSSEDIARELDAYCDWKVNRNFTLSVVGAYGDPGAAVREASGRTKNFAYGMVYLAYSY
jgi:hypothetical protein